MTEVAMGRDEAIKEAMAEATDCTLMGPCSEAWSEHEYDPAAFHRALRERGYVVVPVEPTRAMWAAMANAVVGKTTVHHDVVTEACFRAMLEAAR